MSLFNDILSQIQNKISKDTDQNESIARIISETIHTTIKPDQITLRDNSIRIQAVPTIKMTILLQQQKILRALQAEGFSITTIQ